VSQLYLRRRLLTLKFENDTNLEAHFIKYDELIRQLKSVKLEKEEYIVFHLLLTMPETYNNVVIAIETLSIEKLTIEFVKGRLLDEEAKKTNTGDIPQQSSTAFGTTCNSSFPFKCYGCDKVGHRVSECKFKKKFARDKNNSKNEKSWKKSTVNNVFSESEDAVYFFQLEKIWSLPKSQVKFFGSLILVVQITW